MRTTERRDKIRDVVATRIKSYIADANLKSGDRLPTETEFAARFGVSRLSLREATKALEFLGIVRSKPGRGLTVGQVNMDRVTEYLGFHPALHDVSSEELIDTRVLIETGVLPHVARRMTGDPTIYAALNAINGNLRHARTVAQWVEGDLAFHRCLIEASGLSPLLAFGDLLAVFFRRFRQSVTADRWAPGVEAHQRMIDDLRLGEVARAGEELRRHIESHREPSRIGP